MIVPKMNLRRTYLIARRDYLGYVKTWGFWISFVFPFIIGAIIIGLSFTNISISPTRYETILDETGQHEQAILTLDAENNAKIAGDIMMALGKTVLNEDDAQTLEDIVKDEGVEVGREFLDTKMPGTSKRLKTVDSKMIFVDLPSRDLSELKTYMRGEKTLQYQGEDVKLNGVIHIYNKDVLRVDYWSPNFNNPEAERLARDYFRDLSADNYLKTGGLSLKGLESARKETLEISTFDPTKKTKNGDSEQAITMKDRIPFIASFALAMMLWMTVFSGSYMLLTSMLEEKTNKLLEMMLATTRFSEIIFGKLLGVALLTVTALLPYIIMSIGGVIGFILFGDPEIAAGLVETFSPKLIIFFTVFLILGYIFYGALFIAMGALAESMQDAQTLTTPIMFVLMGCMFVVTIGLDTPDSPLVAFASWFPLSSPFAMIVRLPTDPPLWELLLSVGLLIAATLGIIILSGRVFRFGVLSGSGVKGVTDWFKRTILRRKTV